MLGRLWQVPADKRSGIPGEQTERELRVLDDVDLLRNKQPMNYFLNVNNEFIQRWDTKVSYCAVSSLLVGLRSNMYYVANMQESF